MNNVEIFQIEICINQNELKNLYSKMLKYYLNTEKRWNQLKMLKVVRTKSNDTARLKYIFFFFKYVDIGWQGLKLLETFKISKNEICWWKCGHINHVYSKHLYIMYSKVIHKIWRILMHTKPPMNMTKIAFEW